MTYSSHNRLLLQRHLASFMSAAGALLILTGCRLTKPPPACVVGTPPPSSTRRTLWESVPDATSLELAIDGSGSMLGFTSAGAPSSNWQKLIKAVTLSAGSTNVEVETFRVGSGTIKPLSSWQEATKPCFYQGCGAYAPVSSSLDTVWQRPGLTKGTNGAPSKVPLRLTITDLEANNGDITKLTAVIKQHVAQGSVIGVMALKLPFNGSVYNSNAQVIFKGKTERPIYLLATGPQRQVHKLLDEIKSNASISGIAADSIQISHLDRITTSLTQTVEIVEGIPRASVGTGLPIRLNGVTYRPANDFALVRLFPKAKGVSMATKKGISVTDINTTQLGLAKLESIDSGTPLNGESITGEAIIHNHLVVQIALPNPAIGNVLRVTVPRGALPQQWWVDWDRRDPENPNSKMQTDGLLLLMSNLTKMLVEPGSTPAASLCFMYSN